MGAHRAEMTTGLLRTKLYRPAVPVQHVPRPGLTARLNEGLAAGRGLTVISAPAGAGKTTAAAAWLDTIAQPAAWVSLDAADDEPGRFFSYLLAALGQIDDQIGAAIADVLAAGQVPPADILSATLSNDILAHREPFLLALDDFQVISDETILTVLRTLAQNWPRPLHLALLTREEPDLPLARLRVNNQITELGAADLRFSDAEAATLLNEIMALALAEDEVAALEQKTEGWVAGLQLAGLSLRNRPDRAAFITEFSGTHRHLLRYLTEEVLERQPDAIQQFLLQTAILEEVTGDLADAVTGGSNGRTLLEQLYNDNLFLIPLDDQRRWYRYHHLFQELLRDQLAVRTAADIETLHRRASGWYLAAGSPSKAIEHAIAAEDYETTVALIERHAMDMLLGWHAKTIKRWMEVIPAQWSARSPKTNLALAWMHLLMGDIPNALPYIDRLRMLFSGPELDAEDPAIKAEWLTMQATLASGQGELQEALLLAELALAAVPDDDATVHSLIYNLLASTYKQLNDHERTVAAYEQLIGHGRDTGDFVSEMMGLTGLTLYITQRGDLQRAYALAREGLERVESAGTYLPISAAVYGEVGGVLYQWFRLEEALAYFERAAEVSTLSGYSDAEVFLAIIRTQQALIHGEWQTAEAAMAGALALAAAYPPAAIREELADAQVQLALQGGDLAGAEAALQPFGFEFSQPAVFPDLPPGWPIDHETAVLHLSGLRILAARVERDGAARRREAFERLGTLLERVHRSGLLPLTLEGLLLRAQMETAAGEEAAARADLQEALKLAQPGGFITLFVSGGPLVATLLDDLLAAGTLPDTLRAYAEQIRAAFPGAAQEEIAAAARAELVEPLSARELAVLRRIAAGLTNHQIAAELVISLHTVKKHNSNIYGKLGVGSRTQAVARGRELGLLQETDTPLE